jgi:virulence factor
MTRNKLRVGVIGVGRMGERHARVYSSLSEVEFVGVSDLSPERGRAVAAQHGVAWYEDFTGLLRDVDAVSIATPTRDHFDVAAECLAQKVHVLVEKPIAGTLQEARSLAWLADRSMTVFQVGHIERYNPVFLELQIVLEDLEIVGLNARRLSPFDTSNTDVDVVFDLMIHDLDLVLTLLGGDVECVQAHGRRARMAGADYVVATLCLANGPLATLTASRLTEQKVRLLEVTALGAYVEADLLNKTICIYRRTLPEYLASHQRPLRYRQEGLVERIHVPSAEPLMLELQDFVRCARDGEAPRVGAADGVRALELATTIRGRAAAADAGFPSRMNAVDVRPAALLVAS